MLGKTDSCPCVSKDGAEPVQGRSRDSPGSIQGLWQSLNSEFSRRKNFDVDGCIRGLVRFVSSASGASGSHLEHVLAVYKCRHRVINTDL